MGRGTPTDRRPALCPATMRRSRELTPVRIETERLVLRPFRVDDAAAYADMLADPEAFRYSERGPMVGTESWTRLLRHAGHWALSGYGLFAIEEKASGRFAGEAGLEDFRRGLGGRFDGVPEASWTIAAWARGSGYATEAAAAALGWLEGRLTPPLTVCIVHAGNIASLRVAAKLGYFATDEREYRGYPAILFERRCDSGR